MLHNSYSYTVTSIPNFRWLDNLVSPKYFLFRAVWLIVFIMWRFRCAIQMYDYSALSGSKVALPGLTPPFQEVDYVCVKFCGDRAQRNWLNVTTGWPQTTRRTHRPDSQTRSRENTTAMKTKGHSFFSFFFSPVVHSGRAAPARLPASRAESCLYRAFPTTTATTTTRPIRLTGPVTPRHAKTHRNPATNRLGLHIGTLTLTPDFPRLTITLGGWGPAFRDHPGHDDSAGHNNTPSPILSLTR